MKQGKSSETYVRENLFRRLYMRLLFLNSAECQYAKSPFYGGKGRPFLAHPVPGQGVAGQFTHGTQENTND